MESNGLNSFLKITNRLNSFLKITNRLNSVESRFHMSFRKKLFGLNSLVAVSACFGMW